MLQKQIKLQQRIKINKIHQDFISNIIFIQKCLRTKLSSYFGDFSSFNTYFLLQK